MFMPYYRQSTGDRIQFDKNKQINTFSTEIYVEREPKWHTQTPKLNRNISHMLCVVVDTRSDSTNPIHLFPIFFAAHHHHFFPHISLFVRHFYEPHAIFIILMQNKHRRRYIRVFQFLCLRCGTICYYFFWTVCFVKRIFFCQLNRYGRLLHTNSHRRHSRRY